jgi:hypothetical protein
VLSFVLIRQQDFVVRGRPVAEDPEATRADVDRA